MRQHAAFLNNAVRSQGAPFFSLDCSKTRDIAKVEVPASNGATVLLMNSRTLLALAILLFNINLQAQQPELAQKPDSAQEPPAAQQPASTQPPDSAQPREMELWLYNGKDQERIDRLVSLGIEREVATEFTLAKEEYARWFPLRTGLGQKNAILFLPCVRDNAHLYLMTQQNTIWRVTDVEKPDCHYDMSVSVEITPIRNPAFDEVLMHHVGEGHAGSYSQQDFEVYSVARGKLKQVLDAEEVIVASQYVSPNIDMNRITQKSLFVLVPIEKSRSRIIEETRSSTLNGKLKVQRRQFRWNAAKSRYLPTKFVPLEAAPN
ncbi:MAG: hypothetical protein ACLP7O_08290 [Terracidiphilus sp.]